MHIIHIACSTDDNYAALCGVMLYSLMENNKQNRLHLHILSNELSEENKKKFRRQSDRYGVCCSFHTVNETLLEDCKYRTKVHRLSKAAYYRILLASTLADVSKVIYLDCDMIVLKDLSAIYNLDIAEYGVSAVIDYDMTKDADHFSQLNMSVEEPYFNSGFMLINLDYWRANDSEKELLKFATMPRHVYFHDQDALNYVFKHKWLRIEPKWNRYNIFNINVANLFANKKEMQDFFSDPCVIHFPGRYFKPWFRTWLIPYRKEWLKYLKSSEWKDMPLRRNEKSIYATVKCLYTSIKHIVYKFKNRNI